MATSDIMLARKFAKDNNLPFQNVIDAMACDYVAYRIIQGRPFVRTDLITPEMISVIRKGTDGMEVTATKEKEVPRYHMSILRRLRESRDLDPDDDSQDESFCHMSRAEVFETIMQWEGIIGYDALIKGWIADIYKIELKEGM